MKEKKTMKGLCGKDMKISRFACYGKIRCPHAKWDGIMWSINEEKVINMMCLDCSKKI